MKKYILFVFTFLIIPNYIFSQFDNCEIDCENSTTTQHSVTVVFGPPNCSIDIVLNKTVCGNGEVIIEIIELNTTKYNDCGQPDSGVLMILAIHGLIKDNPLNLQALRQKFVYRSCWRYTDNNFNKAWPCSTDQCCVIEFEFDNNCNRLLPVNISSKGVKSCYGSTVQLETGCHNACYSEIETFESNLKDLDENN